MEEKKSVFEVLNAIDCSEHIEKKKQGGTELSYLSWAWAWGICKKYFPNAEYHIDRREDERGNKIPYHTDGRTCTVLTSVTIEGITYEEFLPIMDFRNQSIPLEKVTSMDVNKAIQRSLTKCLARHGLGLYIYAGEDLPEQPQAQQIISQPKQFNPEPVQTPALEDQNIDRLFDDDMPAGNPVDDLEARLNGCKDIDTLTRIWNDAQVLLAERPEEFATIKKKIAILGNKLAK